ncbi:hypothetical protein [Parapedobacter sp. DT-150]|uniref:hypothetical protein n=1 Tax=Parapedobacter sp. DT-150 TaxID=3396162 RepID=UPI003F1983DC
MEQAPFIKSLIENPAISSVISDPLGVNIKLLIPSTSELIDGIYTIGGYVIDTYVFTSIAITISRQEFPEFVNPILIIKFVSKDMSIFDNSAYHFGKQGLAIEIPDTSEKKSKISVVKEWRKKMGTYPVFDKEAKVKLSKFSNGFCMLTMLFFESQIVNQTNWSK